MSVNSTPPLDAPAKHRDGYSLIDTRETIAFARGVDLDVDPRFPYAVASAVDGDGRVALAAGELADLLSVRQDGRTVPAPREVLREAIERAARYSILEPGSALVDMRLKLYVCARQEDEE